MPVDNIMIGFVDRWVCPNPTVGIIEVYIFTLFRFHSIKIVVPHLYTTYSAFTKRFEQFDGLFSQARAFFAYAYEIISA